MVAEQPPVSAVNRPALFVERGVIDRWRRHYERDRRAFERMHGRVPATHYELAKWLAHKR